MMRPALHQRKLEKSCTSLQARLDRKEREKSGTFVHLDRGNDLSIAMIVTTERYLGPILGPTWKGIILHPLRRIAI